MNWCKLFVGVESATAHKFCLFTLPCSSDVIQFATTRWIMAELKHVTQARLVWTNFFPFFFFFFFFFCFFRFVSKKEEEARRAPVKKREKKKKNLLEVQLLIYVCLLVFLSFFFFFYGISVTNWSELCVTSSTVSAKLLLESRDQIWHKHKTSKYSTLTDLCLWHIFEYFSLWIFSYFVRVKI